MQYFEANTMILSGLKIFIALLHLMASIKAYFCNKFSHLLRYKYIENLFIVSFLTVSYTMIKLFRYIVYWHICMCIYCGHKSARSPLLNLKVTDQ